MPKFRKKPVVIEAWQYTEPMTQMPTWLAIAMTNGIADVAGGSHDPHMTIETLEGTHRASMNDWIIQGVKGELYPCKPDIFVATYKPA